MSIDSGSVAWRSASGSTDGIAQSSAGLVPRRRLILAATAFAALALAGCTASGRTCSEMRRSGQHGRVLGRVPCPDEPAAPSS